VGILLKIKSAASRIADARPDLVITVGTPATMMVKRGRTLHYSQVVQHILTAFKFFAANHF